MSNVHTQNKEANYSYFVGKCSGIGMKPWWWNAQRRGFVP